MKMVYTTEKRKVEKITFGIVGSGWRAGFYLRIAKLLPEQFEVCGVVTRSEEKGREAERLWGVKSYRSLEDLLKETAPGFMVVSVSRESAPGVIREITAMGLAVLAETPPAPNLEELIELNKLTKQGAKIQVAEQYHLQPMHEARMSLAHSGRLGEVSQTQISVANDHHGMSLIRRSLGIKFENARINAFQYSSHIVAGPGRRGLPENEKIIEEKQVIAYLDFGNKLGIYDFARDQHRSWARSSRVLVRGSRGEIKDDEVRYLKDFRTQIEFKLKRQNAGENGNLEGYFLKGILAGEEWVYTNPFQPGRLGDDELAIAACLKKMDNYARGGEDFYSLAEASQDMYLSLMIEKALINGGSAVTESQPWARQS